MARTVEMGRLVAQAPKDQRAAVKRRATAHGFKAYGPFLVELGLHGVLLNEEVRQLLTARAADRGRSLKDEVEALILTALRAEAG